MKTKLLVATILSIIILSFYTSALIVSSVSYSPSSPGSESELRLTLDNEFDNDLEDISFSLDISKVPFTITGSSEFSIDELNSGDDEILVFRLKSSNDAKPGDYSIPYNIEFNENVNSTSTEHRSKSGSVGVSVTATPDLTFSASIDKPVVEEKAKISLKIVNKGFADAKFLSVTILPEGFTLLSDDNVYIGTVSSDDFETANFDVLFKKENPTLLANIEYKNFENKKITQTITLPLTVYSREKGLELGIVSKDNTLLYVSIILIILIIWFAWRTISKRRRLKKSMQAR